MILPRQIIFSHGTVLVRNLLQFLFTSQGLTGESSRLISARQLNKKMKYDDHVWMKGETNLNLLKKQCSISYTRVYKNRNNKLLLLSRKCHGNMIKCMYGRKRDKAMLKLCKN